MTDEDTMRRFARSVGFGDVNGPYIPRRTNGRPGSKPYWVWRTSSFERVQALVAMLWPYLGERRRAKAAEVLASVASNRQDRKRGRCHPDRPYGAKGMCRKCYVRDLYEKKRAA